VDLIYLFCEDASKEFVTLKGENFKYLVKVRRHSEGDTIFLRQKEDPQVLHTYKIDLIDNRSLTLKLVESKESVVYAKRDLHLAWCIIDNKSIEKVLPSLNELGVAKISFLYCDRSQKNFKPDFKRFERILEASMQQCGRSTIMEFDTYTSLESFLHEYPDTKVFDFCENVANDMSSFERVLIGCEGGFSQKERELLSKYENFRLDTPHVLRSESAALAVASRVLL
jgi:16S rRNA (uracil1498-N3)-methyltransferase